MIVSLSATYVGGKGDVSECVMTAVVCIWHTGRQTTALRAHFTDTGIRGRLWCL